MDHTDDLATHFSGSAHRNAVDVIDLDVAAAVIGLAGVVDVVLLDVSTLAVIFHDNLKM